MRRWLVAALLVVATGCSAILGFEDGELAVDGEDGGALRADAEIRVDASEASRDAGVDSRFDAPVDALVDALVDAPVDAAVDARPKQAFETSGTFNGRLDMSGVPGAGGLAAGDQRCMEAAQATFPGRTFVAWLSTAAISAISRVAGGGPWYVGASYLGGELQLKTGTMKTPLNRDPQGVQTAGPVGVWTGTEEVGTPAFGLCSDLALATGGAWLARAHGDSSASADASRTPTAFGWQRGTRYLYDFDWTVRSASTVDMAGAGGGAGTMDASSESALHGLLAFKAYGQQGDAWLFGVSVSALHDVKLAAMGNALLNTPETIHDTFDGREAFVEVSGRGEVRHLRFRAGDPALFEQLLQSVIAESQVVLGGAASAASAAAWQSIETYSVGKLEMHYAVDASDPLYLRRAPTRVLSATALPQGSADGLVPVLAGGSDVHLDRVGSVATTPSSP